MTITRQIHKKSSPDNQLILFLLKREIISQINKVEPIEGVVVYGSENEKQKIMAQVVVTFRYGREEDEVMGLNFSKDLFLISEEIYPNNRGSDKELSKMQQKIIKKYGPNAIPFSFTIPSNTPQTVVVQSGLNDKGVPCGVHYAIKVFPNEDNKMKPNREKLVSMSIRKIEIAPHGKGRRPSCTIRKDFLLSPGELELEANLDKALYICGDPIAVNLTIRNYSNKSVKKIVILVLQNSEISMFTSGNYTVSIMALDSQEGCPIGPGSVLSKTFTLCPRADLDACGVALESQLPGEEKKLASSTLITADHQKEDHFGIQISYCIRVKLLMGAIAGELVGELPFLLMSRPANFITSNEKA